MSARKPCPARALAGLEAEARRYLKAMGGVGANREHVREARRAVERAVVSIEREVAPVVDVRPGERVSDAPIWKEPKP